MSADRLQSGPERLRGRTGVRALALTLAVLAVLGYAGVRTERGRELDAVVTAAAQAEQVISAAGVSLAGLVGYSAAVLSHADLAPASRDAVLQSFVRDAQRFRPGVTGPRTALAGLRILP